ILGSAEEKRALEHRAAGFSEQDLIRFFDMLLRLENELRWTSQARFHLEVGFVKLAKVGYVRDIEEILREIKQGGTSGTISAAMPAAKTRVKPAATEIAPQPSLPAPSTESKREE